MTHRLRRFVTMSTITLLSVGGVAAAASGSGPLSPLLGANDSGPPVTTNSTTTTTTTATTTTTTADVTTAELEESTGLSDADIAAICEAAENHGEAVSTVAKDKSIVGAEHGAAVSEMAKSDCGKNDEPETDVDAESESEDASTFEEICEAAENHGEAVSAVAKDKSTRGADHGAAVSEMAKSDCGKKGDESQGS